MKKLPKVERHIHFEGSLFSLTGKRKVNSFSKFLEVFKEICFKIKSEKDFLFLGDEFFSYLKDENIVYAEFFLSLPVWMKFGFDIFKILENINLSGEKYTNFLKYGIVIDGVRQFHPAYMYKLVFNMEKFKELNVVGFGMGGNENCCNLDRFYDFFQIARRKGFLINVHIGEVVRGRKAFYDLFLVRPDRVGHLLDVNLFNDFIVENNVVVDFLISSNLKTGVVEKGETHPSLYVGEYVNFLINSDDPAIFNTTLTREYEIYLDEGGDPVKLAKNLMREIKNISAFSEDKKRNYLKEIVTFFNLE